ncbi:MAG TPA: hypothetical protein VK890_00205 [Bacteroidia bacterium]|jgi:hypothetical protein|nr:hypothetical protein [Bacteroidia bacterium]
MTLEQQEHSLIANAIALGFKEEEHLYAIMDASIIAFAYKIEDVREGYFHLLDKLSLYAETWICEHQVPEFVKEMHIDLHYKRSFGFVLPSGKAMDVDDFNSPHGLIDWDQHKDCKDDDKIYFFSCVDLDCKTVYKFYDFGSKRHLQ